MLFGIYKEEGNYSTDLIDVRNWKGNEGYSYIDIKQETNEFKLVELPYEIDYIDYLGLKIIDTILPKYAKKYPTLPPRKVYLLSIVNSSRGLDLLKYLDNKVFALKSKEQINVTFEPLPSKDYLYKREIEMVAKGWYNFFNETRLRLNYSPYN